MAETDTNHYDVLLQGFDLMGNVVELEPHMAANIVRHLGARGYEAMGGVMSGPDSIAGKDDDTFRRRELAILRVNKKDAVVGPYVMGVSDEDDGTYHPGGSMLYVRRTDE